MKVIKLLNGMIIKQIPHHLLTGVDTEIRQNRIKTFGLCADNSW